MQNPESVAQKMAGGEGMVDMEVCMYCKYFLKNLLRGLEKSSWSQTPAPLFGLSPKFDHYGT